MQTILQQIKSIDGVIGCSLYNEQGVVLAHVCPLIMDDKQLAVAASTILDCMHALQVSQKLVALDLRFGEGRLIVRPLSGAYISVLCSKNVNLSMVNITLNLALRKLETLLPKPGDPIPAAAQNQASQTIADEASLPLRIAHLQKGDVSSSFDQLGMVAVSQSTARQMSDFFGKTSKKIKITTDAGTGGTFPVMIINDVEMQYDSALVVGPGIEKKLKVEEGTTVHVLLA